MFGSIKIMRVFGIPIRIHFTLILLLPYFALRLAEGLGVHSLLWGWVAAVALFASVALHELGHSVVAIRKGCGVRDIILSPIGGVAMLTRLPARPRDEFQIAIAGPLVSLAIAVTGWMLDDVIRAAGFNNFGTVVWAIGSINMGLFLFNLVPSFPMDGGRIFRAWMTPRLGRLEATRRAAKLGRFFAVLFGIAGAYYGQVFWIIIAFFIYQAAGAEYRAVRMQEMAKHGGGFPFPFGPEVTQVDDEDIVVSPPPYRR